MGMETRRLTLLRGAKSNKAGSKLRKSSGMVLSLSPTSKTSFKSSSSPLRLPPPTDGRVAPQSTSCSRIVNVNGSTSNSPVKVSSSGTSTTWSPKMPMTGTPKSNSCKLMGWTIFVPTPSEVTKVTKGILTPVRATMGSSARHRSPTRSLMVEGRTDLRFGSGAVERRSIWISSWGLGRGRPAEIRSPSALACDLPKWISIRTVSLLSAPFRPLAFC